MVAGPRCPNCGMVAGHEALYRDGFDISHAHAWPFYLHISAMDGGVSSNQALLYIHICEEKVSNQESVMMLLSLSRCLEVME